MNPQHTPQKTRGYHPEQLEIVASNVWKGVGGNFAVSLATFWLLFDSTPTLWLSLWFAPLILIQALWIVTGLRLSTGSSSKEQNKRAREFISVVILGGLFMGLGAWLATLFASQTTQLLIIAMFVGNTSAAIPTLSFIPTAFRAYTLGLMILQAGAAAASGIQTHIVLSPLLLIYITIIIQAGKEFNKSLLRSLELADSLRSEKEKAEQKHKARFEYIANLPHEVRTPLNAIMGFAQLMDYDQSLNADQRENAREIQKAGAHLLDVLNDLITLAELEDDRSDAKIEPMLIRQIFGEYEIIATPFAKKYQVSLSFDLESCAQNAMLRANAERLSEIMLAYISNAAKFNQPGGKIRIYAEKRPDNKVRLNVADDGQGIDEELQPKLFMPFERLGATEADVEGTGMGLVIVKRLAEIMGASVGFTSKSGEGSTFWIETTYSEGS
ncbi:HAMP domain-containing histidine kinase [Myxococcota bacterium]|nr:HAMP domain-containing histidine kinase [Myxococcota bacterium]